METLLHSFHANICHSQLRFYYAKLIDTPEEHREVLGFINPVVDSDDQHGDIFEPERRFSLVFLMLF